MEFGILVVGDQTRRNVTKPFLFRFVKRGLAVCNEVCAVLQAAVRRYVTLRYVTLRYVAELLA